MLNCTVPVLSEQLLVCLEAKPCPEQNLQHYMYIIRYAGTGFLCIMQVASLVKKIFFK